MTSGPCSSWFFLVMKSWFFWCYLGLVTAILCRAAKNSLRGTDSLSRTGLHLSISEKSSFHPPAFEISRSCRIVSTYVPCGGRVVVWTIPPLKRGKRQKQPWCLYIGYLANLKNIYYSRSPTKHWQEYWDCSNKRLTKNKVILCPLTKWLWWPNDKLSSWHSWECKFKSQ
jgi:hypothetical protein